MIKNQNEFNVVKGFWPWQDEVEESWLSTMAMEGWHLQKVGRKKEYHFIKGPSIKVKYCMDYQARQKDKEGYQTLFKDAGWEFVTSVSGWQYFRKEFDGDTPPEIFTDRDSKIDRYNRLLTTYASILICLGVIPITLANTLRFPEGDAFDFLRGVLTGLGIAVCLCFIFMISSVSSRTQNLKTSKK